MTEQDLHKLKSICEENGFEYNITDTDKEIVTLTIRKKNQWEGVEFCHSPNGVRKIDEMDGERLYFTSGTWAQKSVCTPATEREYVEYLKKEAAEKYGEIKEGDLFNLNSISPLFKDKVTLPDVYIREWYYDKNNDKLFYKDLLIYQKGQGASKITEFRASYIDWDYSDQGDLRLSFKCDMWNYVKDKDDVGDYLAEQLQNYLNERL